MDMTTLAATFIPLYHICTTSLLTGNFPDSMKIAKVTPLFKSGDTVIPSRHMLSIINISPLIFIFLPHSYIFSEIKLNKLSIRLYQQKYLKS